jgi:hypothetical protein
VQSKPTRPRRTISQHTGLEAVFPLHRRASRLSKAGTAPIATAKLAATVVIMMNRILMRSSWFRVEFCVRIVVGDAVVLVDFIICAVCVWALYDSTRRHFSLIYDVV